MKFIFEQIRTGGDRNFGYLLGDRDHHVGALVDPSFQPELLIERAEAQNLKIRYIINTHGHHDHVNGNKKAKELTNAQIAVFQGSSVPHDLDLKDHMELSLGGFSIRCIHVPGHAVDHMVLFIPEYEIAITGDHLFVGKIGGTSGEENAQLQFESLKKILVMLPESTTIWPGHDYGCRPSSTMSLEKSTNPFLLTKNVQEFITLKEHWGPFKREYGLR